MYRKNEPCFLSNCASCWKALIQKNGLLEDLLYGWNWYCVHSFPWTPCQYLLKIGDHRYFSRRGVPGLSKGQYAAMYAIQGSGKRVSSVVVSSFPSTLDNTSQPCLKGPVVRWSPWKFLHCHNSFLCTVSLTVYCHSSECEPWIVSVLLSYISLYFSYVIFSCPCIWSYKWLWFSARESVFIFSTLPSAANSIQATIMGYPGRFCLLIMVISWSRHASLGQLCIACIYLERSNLEHMQYRYGAQMAWPGFIHLGISPAGLVFMQLPVKSEAALVLCAQHLRALGSVGRSQLTLSEFMQAHIVHMLKERKVGFSAKAHGLCWASITAAALPVAGTEHSINSHVPEQCWADVPKGTVHR